VSTEQGEPATDGGSLASLQSEILGGPIQNLAEIGVTQAMECKLSAADCFKELPVLSRPANSAA
jgi:hypothetical protein